MHILVRFFNGESTASAAQHLSTSFFPAFTFAHLAR